MSNPSKAKGTAWESRLVDYLKPHWPHVERRTLSGSKDRGDIAGLVGVVVEAKDCRTVTLGAWLDEAEVEKANDGADVGVVWAKRRGKTDPGAGFVVMSGQQFVDLLLDAGYGDPRA
ncbi:MAG: hypothetical protein JWO69_2022 [Thermoleophilia bacterium]|nr:hypothetical protein [Thermoleophilia bacterium]